MKRFLKFITLTLVLAILPMAALADDDFGSAAVIDGQTYTIEQMLTFALQDEYMAQAEYEAIQDAFGVNNPYANIKNAEVTHQEELLRLFEAYGVSVPANTAAGSVVIPATLAETYAIGVQAEISNIAMYQAFLKQRDVPQDVRKVFAELMNASQSHLNAFSRNAEKTGTGLGNGQENGLNRTAAEGSGLGNGNKSADTQMDGRGMNRQDGAGYNAENNKFSDNCDDCSTSQTQQPRGGRNRN